MVLETNSATNQPIIISETQRTFGISLSRHAEPIQWGAVDSLITEAGKIAEQAYAHEVFNRVRFMEGRVLVFGRTSIIPRVLESARVFDKAFKEELNSHSLNNVVYVGFKPSHALQATETLAPLIKLGIPPEEVLETWEMAPEDWLISIDSVPPSIIDRRVMTLYYGSAESFFTTQEFDYALGIWRGHETTLAGVLKSKLTHVPRSIPCGQKGEVVISITQDQKIHGEFMGQQLQF